MANSKFMLGVTGSATHRLRCLRERVHALRTLCGDELDLLDQQSHVNPKLRCFHPPARDGIFQAVNRSRKFRTIKLA